MDSGKHYVLRDEGAYVNENNIRVSKAGKVH